MFFKKRNAEEKAAMNGAAEKLAAWQEKFADMQARTDAGEKYFAMEALESDMKNFFSQKPFDGIDKVIQPNFRKKVAVQAGGGGAAVLLGGAWALAGGEIGIIYGLTVVLGGAMIGLGGSAADAIAGRHNKKLYLANKPLIDGLYALRGQVAAKAKEVWNEMLVHPELIAKSSKVDKLLRYSDLQAAFTAAAKTQMREQKSPEAPKTQKPGNGFNL